MITEIYNLELNFASIEFNKKIDQIKNNLDEIVIKLKTITDNANKLKFNDTLSSSISDLTGFISLANTGIIAFGDNFKKLSAIITKNGDLIAGFGLATSGVLGLVNAFKDVSKEGLNFENGMQLVITSLIAGFGLLMIAIKLFGDAITIATGGISLLLGVVAVLGIAFLTSSKQQTEAQGVMEKYNNTLKDLTKTAEDNKITTEAQIGRAQVLRDQIGELYDVNGKLVGSYDEANSKLSIINELLGTEYKLNEDGTIMLGDKTLAQDEFNDGFDKYIENLKSEALIEAYRPVYMENVKKQAEAQRLLNEKQAELTEKLKETDGMNEQQYRNWLNKNGELIQDINRLKGENETALNAMHSYEDGVMSAMKGNYEEATRNMGVMGEEVKSDLLEMVRSVTEESGSELSAFSDNIKNVSTNNRNNKIGFTLEADTSGMKNNINDTFKKANTSFSLLGINIKIPFLDVGTNYVPSDQLAMIHKGEAVVPKKFNNNEYFGKGNDETNNLLKTLINRVDAIEINPYTTIKDVGNASVKYINNESRIRGGMVINI